MTAPAQASVIARLERAELSARERRLAAEAEADRLLEAARGSVREIEAGTDARVADALRAARSGHLARAHAEVGAIEAELAELDRRVNAPAAPAVAFDAAVELVIASILGERGA